MLGGVNLQPPIHGVLQAHRRVLPVTNRNKPAGYLISPAARAAIFEKLDDAELASVALARLSDGHKPVKVTLDEL